MVDAALNGGDLNDAPVASPCIDICRLDARRICIGCHRTIEEIAEWSRASEARRREILSDLNRRRATLPSPAT